MSKTSEIEVIDLNSCDYEVEVSNYTIPMEQANEIGVGSLLERRVLRIELRTKKYGDRLLEAVLGSTRQEKAEQTFMDMNTWAEVKVVFQ